MVNADRRCIEVNGGNPLQPIHIRPAQRQGNASYKHNHKVRKGGGYLKGFRERTFKVTLTSTLPIKG